jgi:hypothetical protein
LSEDTLRYLLGRGGFSQAEREQMRKALRRLEAERHQRTAAYAEMLYGAQVRSERAANDPRKGAITIVNPGALTEVKR